MKKSSNAHTRRNIVRHRRINSPTSSKKNRNSKNSGSSLCGEPKMDNENENGNVNLFHSTARKKGLFCTKDCLDKSSFRTRHRLIIIFLVVGFGLTIIIAVCRYSGNDAVQEHLIPPDPEIPQPPSWSPLKTFKGGVVCVDSDECAIIGRSILQKNGSAVDTALATLICNGLITMQSMGLGGGFLMTVYERKSQKAAVLNARDCAPLAADVHMFDNKPPGATESGPLSISVPGELAGYWEAHKRYGKLPWRHLFEPTIQLCERGYNLTKALYDDLINNKKKIDKFPDLKEIFVDPKTNEFWTWGSTIKPRKELCKTLRIIAEKGATELYNGTLGKFLVEDVKSNGGILTMKDLNDYRAKWEDPIETNLSGDTKLYTAGLPGSGPLLAFVLNILENYDLSSDSIMNINTTTLTYHRFIEALKYAYAFRTQMGDPSFVNVTTLLKKLTSKDFALSIKEKIDDNKTWNDPQHYGSDNAINEDHGTSHVSVLTVNGDAVSVTSTVNIYFGSGVISKRTGILLNSGMDDFSIPSKINYFGIPPSSSNYISPGKRSITSMTPTILVDPSGNVKMVIGAAGGPKITTSLAYVITRYLWMNNDLKEAIDAARIHHQLYPMSVMYEYGVLKQVIDGLQSLGHRTVRYRERGSVICAIAQKNDTMFANADYRKGGDVYGVD